MAVSILVAYATRYSSTQEVAAVIGETLRQGGLAVELKPASEVRVLDGYQAVVLGAPLFMFHWHSDALSFLRRFRPELAERPLAIFVLGPVHEPYDAKEWQDSRDQLNKELTQLPWLHPQSVELFGGRYDPSKLRFPLKLFAGSEPASDIRDWEAIRLWAAGLPQKLAPA